MIKDKQATTGESGFHPPEAVPGATRFSLAGLTRALPPVLAGLALAALVALLPYCAGYGTFRRTLLNWAMISWQDPTWQHGMLAGPIAGFLVWRRWDHLKALAVRPSWMGLAAAAAGLWLFWLGYRANVYYVGYVAVHVVLVGAVLWLWGWRHLAGVAFALLIFGFAWPFLFLEETLAYRLRTLMVWMTGNTLNFIGVATVQDGTRLVSAMAGGRAMGELFSMNVDGPCSGLRSLFALMMVSALFGYFRQRSWWRRGVMFALSVPMAVLANAVRILLLVFATMLFGEEFALGRGEEYTSNFHLLTGIFVFVVALGGLHLVEMGLNRVFGREKPPKLMRD